MQNINYQLLSVDKIIEQIELCGEPAKKLYRHKPIYKHGDELLLKKDYRRVEKLITILKNKPQLIEEIRDILARIDWLEHTFEAVQNRTLAQHEVFDIKQFLYYTIKLSRVLTTEGMSANYRIDNLERLFTFLDPEQNNLPIFHLSPLFSKRLGMLQKKMQMMQYRLKQEVNLLLKRAGDKLGRPSVKEEFVVSKMQQIMIGLIERSKMFNRSREDFANIHYQLKDTSKTLNLKTAVQRLDDQLRSEEDVVLDKITHKLRPFCKDRLPLIMENVARFDWDFARAVFAIEHHCVIPEIRHGIKINLQGAVNLPLKQHLEGKNRSYQPIDIKLSRKTNLLTGPNMGGKTTALLTLGQFCILSAMGIPVPCTKASIPIFDWLWCNKEHGNESGDLSSFGSEIIALNTVLRKRGIGLILLDEFARGTNPVEGSALLKEVLLRTESLAGVTFATTHYNLGKLSKTCQMFTIEGLNSKVLTELQSIPQDDLESRLKHLNEQMDYRLVQVQRNQAPPLNAVLIAEILGLPHEILRAVKAVLNDKNID